MSKTPHEIILHPLMTEKSALMRDEARQLTFVVRLDANKIEIKSAVEELFDGVKVASVRTQVVRGKVKRYGRTYGKRPNWKKAIISLTPDSALPDFYGE